MSEIIFAPTLESAFAQTPLAYPNAADAGKNCRFGRDGKDKSCYVRWLPDGTGAVFGDWRDGTQYNYQQRDDGAPKPSGDEIRQAKAKADIARNQVEKERDELCQRTAKLLAAERAGLPLATVDHGYAKAKKIKLYGDVRLGQKGQLNIPVFDGDGNLQSVQDIYAPGTGGKSFKKFATDAKMQGGRLVFGVLNDGEAMTLCEGFSTSASVFESGIGAGVNCFFGANLAAVAADLRKRFPNSFIRVAGDLDAHGKGAEYARAAVAAAMPNSNWALPVFSDGRDRGDFNDLHQFAGLDAVRSQLEKCDLAGSRLSDSNDACGTDPLPVPREFDAPALPVTDARDGTKETRPLTEVGNMLRISDLHGEKLRFVFDSKSWLVWRDGCWRWDRHGAIVRELAAKLAKQIYHEGMSFEIREAELFAKHARVSQSSKSIEASVKLLSDQGHIRLSLTQVDADLMRVGFDHARQLIDLRTGIARPAGQLDYITKSLTPRTMGDSAKAVRWHSFLAQIFNNDQELVEWLQRWCGYLLTGSTSEQIFLFFFGLGANGKSVLAELLKYILGDYARTLSSETLTETKRQAGGASPDLADLIGSRFAMSSETTDGAALNEAMVKTLTGGDTIVARKLYCEPVEFVPAFKLLMLGNHKPIVHGTDHGIWRRIRLIPFTRTFSEEDRDSKLLDKLKAESPHILEWMVQGALNWQRLGLGDIPAIVKVQTADYRQSQDVIGLWLSECTTSNNQAETTSTELYSNYEFWAKQNGLKPCANVALGRRLTERGFSLRQSSGKRLWCGISLNLNNHGGYSNVY